MDRYTLCAVCREPILHDEDGGFAVPVADHYVYKRGELSYIELAHAVCAEGDGSPEGYWGVD